MKYETFIVLFHFMPKNYRGKHRFWDDFYETKEYKERRIKDTIWFPKNRWREQGHSVIKKFYSYLSLNFPNPIPYSLFFSPGYDDRRVISDLADKWISDILSGEFFYKKNKYYFTKVEVKEFLTCDWYKHNFGIFDCRELIKYYFDVKVKANKLEFSLDFFINKFGDHIVEKMFQDFFQFICLNKKYVRDINEISDIWDFIRSQRLFDFTNLTWGQVRNLSNEWHYQIRNRNYYTEKMLKTEWKKTNVKDFFYENNGEVWKITEITSGKLLYEEGEIMHHCVFTYLNQCVNGTSAIFSVTHKSKDKDVFNRIATVEISGSFWLRQARGVCNAPLYVATKKIIINWADENNIKHDISL
jgi:hypothetical protein